MSEQGRSLVYESGEWQAHLGRRELLVRGTDLQQRISNSLNVLPDISWNRTAL